MTDEELDEAALEAKERYGKEQKLNWTAIATDFVRKRTAWECKCRWTRSDCSLVVNTPFTAAEKAVVVNMQANPALANDWDKMALAMGTGRSAYQCFRHYQRTLNVDIVAGGRKWTKEEDTMLQEAVDLFGEK